MKVKSASTKPYTVTVMVTRDDIKAAGGVVPVLVRMVEMARPVLESVVATRPIKDAQRTPYVLAWRRLFAGQCMDGLTRGQAAAVAALGTGSEGIDVALIDTPLLKAAARRLGLDYSTRASLK